MAFIQVNGTDLFYSEQGVGTPILLIHGTGMNADMWGDAVPALAAQHRVIAYDRRGHSRSTAALVKDYHLHGEDAAGLLERLCAGPATVVGWSAGGIIALDVAISHPNLVQSLVLYEPPLHAKKHPDLRLVQILLKVQIERRLRGPEHAAVTFLRYALSSTQGDSALDRWPSAWSQAIRNNAAATLTDLDAGTGEQVSEAQIRKIGCPVTLLRGELSQPFLVKATERLRKLLPQATYEIVLGAAHGLHLDQCRAFVSILQRAAALE